MHASFKPVYVNKRFPARLPALFATYSVVGFDPAAQCVVEVVAMRLHASRSAARIHACAWIYPAEGVPRRGHGYAGGGGYCRRSAAGAYALEAAGVELTEEVNGRGVSVLRKALLATARAARPDLIGLEVISHE